MDAFNEGVQAVREEEKQKENEQTKNESQLKLVTKKIEEVSRYVERVMSPKGYFVIWDPFYHPKGSRRTFAVYCGYSTGWSQAEADLSFLGERFKFSVNDGLELSYTDPSGDGYRPADEYRVGKWINIGWQDDLENWDALNRVLGEIYGRTGDVAKENQSRRNADIDKKNRIIREEKYRHRIKRIKTWSFWLSVILIIVWVFK